MERNQGISVNSEQAPVTTYTTGPAGMSCMWPYPHPVQRYPHYRDYFQDSHKLQTSSGLVSTSAPSVNNVESMTSIGHQQHIQQVNLHHHQMAAAPPNQTATSTTILQKAIQQPMVSQQPVLQHALTQGVTQSTQLQQQQLQQQQQIHHQLQHQQILHQTVLSGTVQNVITTNSNGTHLAHSNATAAAAATAKLQDNTNKIITRVRLEDLVREVDPNEQIDEDVEDMLLQLADDFVESCVTAACLLAKHRKANTIDVKDVQLHLERNWNMWIPGFGSDELRPYKRASVTEAHKQRLSLIRKTIKKY